jgi:hypothetical protein
MTTRAIGRKTLIKHTAISVVTILLLLTITVLIFGRRTNETITVGRIFKTYWDEFVDNVDFVAIQTILTLVTIWFVGGLSGRLIIEKSKNKFLIGGLSILILWISLFVGSALTAGVMNSVKYGGHGFKSAFVSWMIYGLIPFFIFGIIHGLLIGFPLGHEIKKNGEKLNALQQNV